MCILTVRWAKVKVKKKSYIGWFSLSGQQELRQEKEKVKVFMEENRHVHDVTRTLTPQIWVTVGGSI